ncbi:hypothetical protein NL108_013435 [Boleophthalmus pectinirostris]|nr:hypothetical protein NL108_013435 [Boleophthalmus pectinirostris]
MFRSMVLNLCCIAKTLAYIEIDKLNAILWNILGQKKKKKKEIAASRNTTTIATQRTFKYDEITQNVYNRRQENVGIFTITVSDTSAYMYTKLMLTCYGLPEAEKVELFNLISFQTAFLTEEKRCKT